MSELDLGCYVFKVVGIRPCSPIETDDYDANISVGIDVTDMNDTLANHPWLYPALLHLHRSCVATSIGLFFARGLGVSFLRTWPMQAFCRYLSVAIDVALLSTGLSLLIILSYNPLQQAWLSVKLALLVLYIMLGTLALKRGRTRVQRLVFFMAALAVALTIVGIALARHPAGWWR